MNALAVLSLAVSAASAIFAGLAWRRTGAFKTSDFRLLLRKEAREVGILLDAAQVTLSRARQSHVRVLGILSPGGNVVAFEQEADADNAELAQLRRRAQADFGEIDEHAPLADLENKLVDAHGIKTRVGHIHDKYAAVLTRDDTERDAIRDMHYRQ